MERPRLYGALVTIRVDNGSEHSAERGVVVAGEYVDAVELLRHIPLVSMFQSLAGEVDWAEDRAEDTDASEPVPEPDTSA